MISSGYFDKDAVLDMLSSQERNLGPVFIFHGDLQGWRLKIKPGKEDDFFRWAFEVETLR